MENTKMDFIIKFSTMEEATRNQILMTLIASQQPEENKEEESK